MTEHGLIEEIAAKECERYELERNGFVADRQAMVRELSAGNTAALPAGCSLNEFSEWKSHLLNDWYSRKGFAGFFRRKVEKRCMSRLVKRLMQNELLRFRKKQTETTIDEELNVEEGRTVAFKLSSSLFTELYRKMCCGNVSFLSPGQLENSCTHTLRSLFPLKYPVLYERLSARDNEFWEEIWRLIRRFIHFLVIERRGKEDEETVKEVCMETVLSVQEQLERGRLRPIISARHLRNSLQMTGRNKFHEWLRAEEKKEAEMLLGEEGWLRIEQEKMEISTAENKKANSRFDYLLEVDEKNEYAVCCALADVLTYGSSRIYEELVGEKKDLAKTMLMLYVENRQYEDISRSLYGIVDETHLVNLRKSVSRGKEYLKKRMVTMIMAYKKKGEVPFVAEREVE